MFPRLTFPGTSRAWLASLILAVVASSRSESAAIGCQSSQAPAASATISGTPTFSNGIAAMIHSRCSVCHRSGQVGPFPLMTLDEIRSRSRTIAAVVREDYMPPWKPVDHGLAFSNDRSLTPEQKKGLLQWIEAGCPEGDPAAVPPVPDFPEGWSLGKPDLVIRMQDAFEVPADGPDLYRSFVFPLQLPEDKWVKAVELRPTAGSAVHHALFFLDLSGQAREMDGQDGKPGIAGMGFLTGNGMAAEKKRPDAGGDEATPDRAGANAREASRSARRGWLGRLAGGRQTASPASGNNAASIEAALARGLGGHVPGAVPVRLPGDLAMELPAHSDIVMQTHFHPSGKAETEQAELGLYLTETVPSRKIVPIQLPVLFGFSAGIDIPPGESEFRIADQLTLPVAVEAISVGGHAHYICSRMKMTARLPDGRSIVLMEIRDWDLDWQDRYYFADPVALPAGTVLDSEIVYDNSADNPENPYQPPQRIRWGRESNDEMGSITLAVVSADESDRPKLESALQQHFRKTVLNRFAQGRDLGQLLKQLDSNGDGRLQRTEAPPRLAGRGFDLLDRDQDGSLDEQELAGLAELIQRFGSGPTGPDPDR